MGDIVFFIGALVPTFLLSRLMLWVFGRYLDKGVTLALIANLSSLAVAILILWSSGSFSDVWLNVIAQAVWLAVDLVRLRAKTAEISN
jgi:hypothetical protein